MRPDLRVMPQKFSEQNAFFFATLSKLAYRTKSEAEGFLKGNATCEGLGFTDFHWFEVINRPLCNPFIEAYLCAPEPRTAVRECGTVAI